MPHQCVRCGTFYEDGADELLKGCSKCQGRFFFYVKKGDIEKAKQLTVKLTQEEKQQIEKDVLEIVGEEAEDNPVILELENIRVLKPGKYELDLVELFKGTPLIYRMGEGKYMIDISTVFNAAKKIVKK